MDNMKLEDLLALGFDEATAKSMVSVSAPTETGGRPAPQLKINYDKEDILSEAGVKKGDFISGYILDRQNLTIKEEGINLGKDIELVVIGSVFQNTSFDIATKTVDVSSNIFVSPFDSKKSYNLKDGKSIVDLKSEGKKVTFDNILAILVKTDGGYQPYMLYLHGTAYYEFYKQLEGMGIGRDIVNKYTFKVSTKRVATNFQPAWVVDIKETKPRSIQDLLKIKEEVSSYIKKFSNWIDNTNGGHTESVQSTVKDIVSEDDPIF